MKFSVLAATILFAPFCLMAPAFAVNPDHLERLLKTNQCPRCDLSGANLANKNLFGANLNSANLTGADLTGANLGFANLTDAYLKAAKLKDAYLYLATLERTDLRQVDLSNAYMREVLVADVNLQGANLSGVNLSGVSLSGVDLSGVNLSGANLSRSVFRGPVIKSVTVSGALASFAGRPEEAQAKLEGTNLTGANLRGALLQKVLLKGAILDGADLQDADLRGAILAGASLKDVKNVNLEGTYQSEVEAKAAPMQSEARYTMGSAVRQQQYYFVEKGRFNSKFNDLRLGTNSETAAFRYQVIPQKNLKDSVMMTAIAKQEGLRSYTAAVFAVKRGTKWTTVAQVCETEQLSKTPPAMPNPPRPNSDTIQCAEGSRPVKTSY